MTAYEDEIDLRPYIIAVLRNWWKIGLLAFLFAIITFLSLSRRPNNYEATATILLTRSRPTLSLAQSFPTVAEPVDAGSRMNAILTIAQSNALAVETIRAMGDALPEQVRSIEALKGAVRVTAAGDAILVTAVNEKPDVAAAITNEWSRQMVISINSAYNSEQPLSEIQNQLESAQEEYAVKQNELEALFKDDRSDLLEGQLDEAKNLLDSLTGGRSSLVSYYTLRKQNMEELLIQLEALKQQLKAGSSSRAAGIGDAIAVLRARAESFGIDPLTGNVQEANSEISSPSHPSSSGLTFSLQMNEVSSLDDAANTYEVDLDRIISQAQQEKARAVENLEALTRQITQEQEDQSIQEASIRLQELRSQAEGAEARKRELTSQRDLAWQAFQALAQKEAEIKNGSEANNQVNLAFEAYPPENPTPRGSLTQAAAAGAMGLFLGVMVVIAAHWWKSLGLSKRTGQAGSRMEPVKK